MVPKSRFVRRQPFLWEIPAQYRPAMKVPLWLFADEHLLEDALGDQSIGQAVNAAALYNDCPSGVGTEGRFPLSAAEFERVCREGARWALAHGLAEAQDLARTEEEGCLEGAQPDTVSERANQRGRPQLGTLGAGNHLIQVDAVAQVLGRAAARG